jgi:hypothetical protein
LESSSGKKGDLAENGGFWREAAVRPNADASQEPGAEEPQGGVVAKRPKPI